MTRLLSNMAGRLNGMQILGIGILWSLPCWPSAVFSCEVTSSGGEGARPVAGQAGAAVWSLASGLSRAFIDRQLRSDGAANGEEPAGASAQVDRNDMLRTIRHERLTAYLAAWRTWLNAECSLTVDQQRMVEELCKSAVEESQQLWALRWHEGRSDGLLDFAPYEMTRTPGPAEPTNRTSFQSRLRSILEDDQKEQVAKQQSLRSVRLMESDRARVIAVIDEQLHLSSDQRARLDNELRALIRNSSTSLFGFETTGSPMEYLSARVVAWRISELDLTAEQRLTMESYFPELQRREANVIRLVLDLDNWEVELGELAAKYSESLKEDMQLRIAEYVGLWKLSPEQEQHLSLAAAGAVTRTVSDWRSSVIERLQGQSADLKALAAERAQQLDRIRAEQQLRQLHGLNTPFVGVSLSIPINAEALDLTRVQNHAIWRRALAQVRQRSDADSVAVSAWGRASCVDCTLTILDREMWFSESQRTAVRDIVGAALPPDIHRVQQPGRELLYLALALKDSKFEEVDRVLLPPQRRVWEQLTSQFDYGDDSVQISLRDGSQFVLEYGGQSLQR